MLTCPSSFPFLQLGNQPQYHESGLGQDCRGSAHQQDPDHPEVSPATLPLIYILTPSEGRLYDSTRKAEKYKMLTCPFILSNLLSFLQRGRLRPGSLGGRNHWRSEKRYGQSGWKSQNGFSRDLLNVRKVFEKTEPKTAHTKH